MHSLDRLSSAVRQLYGIVDFLEASYSEHERHFTLDGHLLGSIGEVYVAERYNVKLFVSSFKGHDGVTKDERKRLVQIKVTQSRARKRAIGLSSEPKWLLVLQVDDNGEFIEMYNGPGSIVWNQVKDKPRPSNGQYQIALSKLSELNESVSDDERLDLA